MALAAPHVDKSYEILPCDRLFNKDKREHAVLPVLVPPDKVFS